VRTLCDAGNEAVRQQPRIGNYAPGNHCDENDSFFIPASALPYLAARHYCWLRGIRFFSLNSSVIFLRLLLTRLISLPGDFSNHGSNSFITTY
jgi:hypothetical protein